MLDTRTKKSSVEQVKGLIVIVHHVVWQSALVPPIAWQRMSLFQGGHGIGTTDNLDAHFFRQGKHKELPKNI